MDYQNYVIRAMRGDEYRLLDDFLYEAIFQKEGSAPVPREAIYDPSLRAYVEGFGEKKDDHCLVAEWGNRIVGAVWARIIPGYGHVDDETPELAISLYKDYRGKGIGSNLMKEMLSLLKGKGYRQVSLSVQKDNYAVRMYEGLGFNTIKTADDDYLMLCSFDEEAN